MEQNTVVDKKSRCSMWRKDAKDKTEHHTVALGTVTSLKNCGAACGSAASTSGQNKTTAIFISSYHVSRTTVQTGTILQCFVIAHGGCLKTIRESALKVDSWAKKSLAILGSRVCIGSVLNTTLSNNTQQLSHIPSHPPTQSRFKSGLSTVISEC